MHSPLSFSDVPEEDEDRLCRVLDRFLPFRLAAGGGEDDMD